MKINVDLHYYYVNNLNIKVDYFLNTVEEHEMILCHVDLEPAAICNPSQSPMEFLLLPEFNKNIHPSIAFHDIYGNSVSIEAKCCQCGGLVKIAQLFGSILKPKLNTIFQIRDLTLVIIHDC